MTDSGQTPDDNHIIPYVVVTLLFAYLASLPLFIFYDYHNHKLPKLIVMTDIRKIRKCTFYLMVVETGNNIMAGSSANICCRFYGEKGRSQTYLIKDHHLDTIRQNDQDSYLISSDKDLGNLEQLRIWHDNTGHTASWYCRKVLVRNVKTGDIWVFFVQRWLSVEKESAALVYTIDAATKSEIKAYYKPKPKLRGYYQYFRENNVWISPFTCHPSSSYTRAERFTTASTIFCTYMIFLIFLIGAPSSNIMEDVGNLTEKNSTMKKSMKKDMNADNVWEWNMLAYACLASILGLFIGFITVFAFRRVRRIRDRIPTLILWQNDEMDNSAKPTYIRKNAGVFENAFYPQVTTKSSDKSQETYFSAKSRLESDNSNETDHNSELLRTPEGEGEVLTDLHAQEGVERNEPTDKTSRSISSAKHIVSFSLLMKAKTYFSDLLFPSAKTESDNDVDTDQQKPAEEITPSKNVLEIAPEKNVLEIAPEKNALEIAPEKNVLPEPEKTLSLSTFREESKAMLDTIQEFIVQNSDTESAHSEDSEEDEGDTGDLLESDFSSVVKVQLVETENKEAGESFYLSSNFRAFIWWYCISIILGGSFVVISYGVRFSHAKSVKWCISLVCTIFVSFLIIQPLKVLLEYLWTLRKIRHKKLRNDLEQFAQTKFKLMFVKQSDTTVKIWPLDFLHYQPTTLYEPLPGSEIFDAKLKGRRKLKVEKGFADIIAFSIILFYAVFSAQFTRDVKVYDIYNSLEKLFHLSKGDLFHQIQTSSDFYSYMNDKFIPAVQYEKNLKGEIVVPDPTDKIIRLMNRELLLLGVPSIRQVRVKRGTGRCGCAWLKFKNTSNAKQCQCNEGYIDTFYYSNEDKENYSESWKNKSDSSNDRVLNKIWRYRSAEETQNGGYNGLLSSYGGGGYMAELGRIQNVSKSVLNYLEQNQWIDTLTRAIFVQFVSYNPNINLYGSISLILETTEAQKYVLGTQIRVTRFKQIKHDSEIGQSILTTIFGFSLVYLVLVSIQRVLKRYSYHRKVHKVIFDIFLSVDLWIACVCIILILYEQGSTSAIEESFRESKKAPINKHRSIENEEDLFIYLKHFYVILILLSLLKLWHLIAISNPRFFIIALAFHLTKPFVLGMFLLTFAILFGFGSSACILLGTNIDTFGTVGQSILVLIYQVGLKTMLPYSEMSRNSAFFGRVIFCIFNIFVVFIYINVLISVIMTSLEDAKEVSLQRSFEFSYVSFMWMQIQHILPKRLRAYINNLMVGPVLTEEKQLEMESHFVEILGNHLSSVETLRSLDMRSRVRKLLEGTDQVLLSRKEKQKMKQDKIERFEQNRLDGMRRVLLKFIKKKTRRDFSANEMKRYDKFNRQILEARYQNMEDRLDQMNETLDFINSS